MEEFNVVSLYDGISCAQLALQRANKKVDNYFASEIDENCMKVTNNHFQNTKHIGDVQFVTEDTFKNFKINLLVGGSPCQGFSKDGKGLNFDDPRSALFFEFIRLKNELNPKHFMLENVAMKKEWQDIITKHIGVEPVQINSSLVSAQKRPRLYWTNIPIGEIEDKGIILKDIISGDHKEINSHPVIIKKEKKQFFIKNATNQGYLIAEEGDGINLSFPNSKTRRGRVSKQKTNTINTGCNYGVILNGNLVELNIRDYEALQTLPIGYTEVCTSISERKKMIGNAWTVDIAAEIFKNIK